MAKTDAERQAEYRKRKAKDLGERRINTWVSREAFDGLRRLSNHQGIPQRDVLENLIKEADGSVMRLFSPGSPELREYLGEPESEGG